MTNSPSTTSLADTENTITAALTTIRRNWDHMLPRMKSASFATFGGHGAGTSTGRDRDNGDHNTDVSNLDIVLSDRGDITAVLNGWCRVVIDDFDVTTVIPHGHDVTGMCEFLSRWARHMTGHEACADMLDELQDCARKVQRHAQPQRKSWLGIGICPLRNDETRQQCGGNVRSFPDQEAGESWATCQTCGTKAVVSWWEREIFGPDGSALITVGEVRTFVHAEFGKLVGAATIRKWIQRGWIESAGTDSSGRTLYDKGSIAFSLQRRRAV